MNNCNSNSMAYLPSALWCCIIPPAVFPPLSFQWFQLISKVSAYWHKHVRRLHSHETASVTKHYSSCMRLWLHSSFCRATIISPFFIIKAQMMEETLEREFLSQLIRASSYCSCDWIACDWNTISCSSRGLILTMLLFSSCHCGFSFMAIPGTRFCLCFAFTR